MKQVETAKAKRKRRAVLKKEPGDPCWDGYCQRGTKVKNGREVPNCVPIESAAESFTPPPAVAKQARKGLELRKKHGKGGTNIGAGRATQLANRKPVSLAIVKRIKAYFDRHQVDKQGKDWANKSNPSKGYIAWLLWGGQPGYAWAKKICKQAETAGATMSVQDLIRGHAETAAKAKAVYDWKEGRTPKEIAEFEKIAKAVGNFTGDDYDNWLGEDGVRSGPRFKKFNKAVYAFLGDDLAHDAEQLARLDYLLMAAVADKKPRGDSMVGQLYAEWKRRNKDGAGFASDGTKVLKPKGKSKKVTRAKVRKAMKETASVRDLIGRHKRAHEIATETVEINQHYLLTTKFMHAAKRQANALGLEYSDNFQVDETVGTGLAENKITISGEQKNVDAFKRWLEGNKPKEEGGGEKASVGVLIAQHAETAARKKTVKRARKPKMDANKNKQARLEAKKKKLQVELREVEGKISQCRKGRATTDMTIGAPGL